MRADTYAKEEAGRMVNAKHGLNKIVYEQPGRIVVTQMEPERNVTKIWTLWDKPYASGGTDLEVIYKDVIPKVAVGWRFFPLLRRYKPSMTLEQYTTERVLQAIENVELFWLRDQLAGERAENTLARIEERTRAIQRVIAYVDQNNALPALEDLAGSQQIEDSPSVGLKQAEVS